MRTATFFAFTVVTSCCLGRTAHAECPATTAADPLFGTSIAGWYGTEALAVTLSSPARWSTSSPGTLSEKLFWRSAGFRPGLESELKITVRSLDGQPVTGTITDASNAYIPDEPPEGPDAEIGAKPGGWHMLTGVDFPDAGC